MYALVEGEQYHTLYNFLVFFKSLVVKLKMGEIVGFWAFDLLYFEFHNLFKVSNQVCKCVGQVWHGHFESDL